MIDEQRIARVFAWLIRNEDVEPEKIVRAVNSARSMKLGESTALTGQDEAMRAAFVFQETERLLRH